MARRFFFLPLPLLFLRPVGTFGGAAAPPTVGVAAGLSAAVDGAGAVGLGCAASGRRSTSGNVELKQGAI